MQTLEQPNQSAADRIYWLAFLLTGDREPSVDMAIEALDCEDDGNPFFSTWMRGWSRKVVIAKALAAIREELVASGRRTASKRAEKPVLPPRNWTLDGDTTKIQLERALLAVDVFPRCALLLSVFEGLSLDDAASLLDVDHDSVRRAQIIGLRELTSNLARMQGWTSTPTNSYVMTSETQHA